MITYPKINAPFKRDEAGKLIDGDWATDELSYLQDNLWHFTEKIDGTNIRIHLHRPVLGNMYVTYAGRTDRADLPAPLLSELEIMFPASRGAGGSDRHIELEAWMLENELTDVILFGEGYGPKIQSGGKYGTEQRFILFDVYIDPWWLNYNDVLDVGHKLGVSVVPSVGTGTLHDGIDIIRAGALLSKWGPFVPEGVVAKPMVQLFDRKGQPVWTKIKAKDFGVGS